MESSVFIVAAYGISGLLIGGLCLATWLRVRRANAQSTERNDA